MAHPVIASEAKRSPAPFVLFSRALARSLAGDCFASLATTPKPWVWTCVAVDTVSLSRYLRKHGEKGCSRGAGGSCPGIAPGYLPPAGAGGAGWHGRWPYWR